MTTTNTATALIQAELDKHTTPADREALARFKRQAEADTAVERLEAANAKIATLEALLREATKLGLTFDIGTAYIRRSYIDHQTDLVARINAALS